LKVGRFFLNISETVSSTATKPLQTDRYYGGTGGGSHEFMPFRIVAAWERGKLYGFLFSFHAVDFVLALHAAAKRM